MKYYRWILLGISRLFGVVTAFFWVAMIFGVILWRHVDNPGEVIGRVREIGLWSIGTFTLMVVFDMLAEKMKIKI